jgi:hypothetical protein
MSNQIIIKKRAVFAEIHQDTRGSKQHIFSIEYRKKDGTIGYKSRVSKSFKNLPRESKFRQNVNHNHILLLFNHDNNSEFEILIDLLIRYNDMLIDHTV